jgi:hypothetical protein
MRRSIPLGIATFLSALMTAAAVAQTYPPLAQPSVRTIPRIQVTPRVREQYYRDCVDWYAVEPRLTGPTIVPHMRCQWVKRYYAY